MNQEFLRLEKECGWSRAEIARQLEISSGAVTQYGDGTTRPSKTVIKLFRLLLAGTGTSVLRDAPPTDDAEKRRADAAEARLERAKKALRAALAELESGVKY